MPLAKTTLLRCEIEVRFRCNTPRVCRKASALWILLSFSDTRFLFHFIFVFDHLNFPFYQSNPNCLSLNCLHSFLKERTHEPKYSKQFCGNCLRDSSGFEQSPTTSQCQREIKIRENESKNHFADRFVWSNEIAVPCLVNFSGVGLV